MSKIDITSIFKNLSKNELIDVISIAQEILSDLFSYDEIKDSVYYIPTKNGSEASIKLPDWKLKNTNK